MFRFFTLFLCSISLVFAKAPSLSPHDAKSKIQEILKSHACHHKMDEQLIKRSFVNMIDELDPLKLYFLKPELETYLNPSDELLVKTLNDYNQAVFTEYLKIYALMEKAIARRNRLEEKVIASEEKILLKKFKDIDFAPSENHLYLRLCEVKALHQLTLAKLKEEPQKFFNKINKRRLAHESELLGKTQKDKDEMALILTIKSLASSLDSQTHYFTPKEANQFLIQVQQRLFGIGAQLRDDVTGLGIVKIIEGSPAHAHGQLKVGDTIIAVDKQPITGMDISEAVELIRGPEGTKVTLTIMSEQEETKSIELTRGEIVIQETRLENSYEPFGDGVLGIFHLFSFYQDEKTSSAEDLAKAIVDLSNNHNLKGVVLDLRFNGGGLLTQAVAVCGLFMKPGVVVSVKDNTGFTSHLRTVEKNPLWTGPLVIVTNKASASAAEIVAQTLQDYGRAIVVGDETSFGKGTFQTFTLDSSSQAKVNQKGEYKVTRGLYYTASGKSPQLHGVKSDIVVYGPLAFSDYGEKHAKFPLQPDEIFSSIEDSMNDISLFQKLQLEKIYESSKQVKSDHLDKILPILKNNSEKRLNQNKSYQDFIVEIQKEDLDADNFEKSQFTDFQLQESIDTLKDLIFLNYTFSKAA